MITKPPPLERIMQRVVKHPNGCWEWVGKCRSGTTGEYGCTRLNGRSMSTHRAVWILTKGFVPGELLHQCQMKLCCNPMHLKEGTHQENMLEAMAARNGVYWNPDGARKVPKEDESLIEQRVSNGEKQSAIAKEYGVTRGCICFLVKRVRQRMKRN